jgi:hypothetical protein
MFDDDNTPRRVSLVAGLILLIVLAAVAAMPGTPGAEDPAFAVAENTALDAEVAGVVAHLGAVDTLNWIQSTVVEQYVSDGRTRSTGTRRVAPNMHDRAVTRMLDALGPITAPMSACFADDALVRYDLGIAPGAAVEVLTSLLEAAVPDVHARLQEVLYEFTLATGLDPTVDFLPHLGHGVAVGLLPPEEDIDGWPLPRKVVIMRVLDDDAVARYLEAWITWVAGAVAPMTHGILGARIDAETVAGFDLVGLRMDGLLPVRFPLPSPSYVVADGFLVVSPVRSAVAETIDRLGEGCSSTPDAPPETSVVEEVWMNLPEWPRAWQRAEPHVGSILAWLGVESPTAVQACGSFFQLLGGFQPAHGTTSLTPEGGFVFRIEFAPAE